MNKYSQRFSGWRSFCYQMVALAFVVAPGTVRGQQDSQSKIPAVGDKAPDFTLQALDGRPVTLSKLTVDSPVVLVVLRGYPGYQCPICSVQVGSLLGRSKEFAAAGATVVLVYPGPGENLNDRATEFFKARSFPDHFVVVTDPDYKFTQVYSLRWNAPRETAYPSTFVVDRQGTVRFVKVSKSHGDRANVSDILKSLADAK